MTTRTTRPFWHYCDISCGSASRDGRVDPGVRLHFWIIHPDSQCVQLSVSEDTVALRSCYWEFITAPKQRERPPHIPPPSHPLDASTSFLLLLQKPDDKHQQNTNTPSPARAEGLRASQRQKRARTSWTGVRMRQLALACESLCIRSSARPRRSQRQATVNLEAVPPPRRALYLHYRYCLPPARVRADRFRELVQVLTYEPPRTLELLMPIYFICTSPSQTHTP